MPKWMAPLSTLSIVIRAAAVALASAWVMGLLTGCGRLQTDPMAPWSKVRSVPEIEIINSYTSSCTIDARTKDGEIRVLGTVSPGDTVVYRLPFADQDVMIVACNVETIIKVDRPRRWTLEITPISQPEGPGVPRRPTTSPRIGAADASTQRS